MEFLILDIEGHSNIFDITDITNMNSKNPIRIEIDAHSGANQDKKCTLIENVPTKMSPYKKT